jgi:hypothetical protein
LFEWIKVDTFTEEELNEMELSKMKSSLSSSKAKKVPSPLIKMKILSIQTSKKFPA